MSDALRQLQQLIDEYVSTVPCPRILEAGCGSMSKVRLPGTAYIVGMDISKLQLERNPGLHEKILADIQTVKLPGKSFDMIICWDVLEHLEAPQKAIANLLASAKPGGLLILAFPNLYSVKGLVTKLTPHSVHVWYYKKLLHVENAGQKDTPPFTTPLKLGATFPAIIRQGKALNASVSLFAFRESTDMQYVRRNFWIMNVVMKTASWISRMVTLGRADAIHSDCILVLRAGAAA
jgi:SAM-dependent methyltransferase